MSAPRRSGQHLTILRLVPLPGAPRNQGEASWSEARSALMENSGQSPFSESRDWASGRFGEQASLRPSVALHGGDFDPLCCSTDLAASRPRSTGSPLKRPGRQAKCNEPGIVIAKSLTERRRDSMSVRSSSPPDGRGSGLVGLVGAFSAQGRSGGGSITKAVPFCIRPRVDGAQR